MRANGIINYALVPRRRVWTAMFGLLMLKLSINRTTSDIQMVNKNLTFDQKVNHLVHMAAQMVCNHVTLSVDIFK